MYRILVNCFNPRSVNNIHLGFKEAGCEVETLFFSWDIAGKNGELVSRLNRKIDVFKPDFVFTYGWWDIGIDLNLYLSAIRAKGLFHIFWAYDDPVCFEEISMPIAQKSDIVFTTVEECIPEYRKRGVKAYLLMHSCHPGTQKRVKPVGAFSHDIVLLANNYNIYNNPEYFKFRIKGVRDLMEPLVENDFDLKVWGLWWRHTDRAYTLPEKFYGGVLNAGYEARVYSSCKIALGLQSVGTSRTHFSVRTLEAMACGALHLSQYSPSLENFFKKGIHLEWSKSRDETLEIARFYLKKEKARIRIAKQGQREVYENHSLLKRMEYALGIIAPLL